MLKITVAVLAAMAIATPASAQDANAGRTVFQAQCALCHSAAQGDNGGAQGPSLIGVIGRDAASDSQFAYTQALRDSHLHWDKATLDRFLTDPASVVPGTAMAVAITDATERANIIAYFTALKDGTYKEQAPRFGPPGGGGGFGAFGGGQPQPEGDADWKQDAPGRVHRINTAELPAPFTTPSAARFPRVVERPADAALKVPAGFEVNTFATGLSGPRAMQVAPNGDIFVTETSSGRVKVMRPSADGSQAEKIEVFAQGLRQPFGMAFYPNGDKPEWLYVAETNRVVRYPYSVGDTVARSIPEIIVAQLSAVGGGHYTRDIVFSPDGKRMFVSVGSQSNVAENITKKTPEEIKAWESEHGFGAAWGDETSRAGVLVYEAGIDQPGRVFATGIRNCVGLSMQQETGDLWCTVNERDMLGDDLVPDYSTTVKEGGYYGWPWYYMGNHEDPRLKDHRPDLAGKAIVPDVPYQAHSAALNLVFYPKNAGKSAFPEEYTGDGFAVFHGSWNRASRTGHKVVRVLIEDGKPTGAYEDFMVGMITEDGNAWGRPVGATVAKDGSLLISDDGTNLIYRIAYKQ
ncbi:MAG: sorbosone dehydrogenase [Gammaproteobacteria bacterium]|nr:sorbosone dehydrogenase [Gammaproteobacteria bacterium]